MTVPSKARQTWIKQNWSIKKHQPTYCYQKKGEIGTYLNSIILGELIKY